MTIRTRLRVAIGGALLMSLAACGSGLPADSSSSDNDMRVVAGDEDKVEADGTIELTSEEIQTCKVFIKEAFKVHDNMLAWEESGKTGEGWASYTAGLVGWFQKLELEIKTSTTPEFLDALQTTAEGGTEALEVLAGGVAPEDDHYDRQKIIEGLESAADICESAGIDVFWY